MNQIKTKPMTPFKIYHRVRHIHNRRVGIRGKIRSLPDDKSKIPVGGRLRRFRAAWKGAHHESIIKTGLTWSWEKIPPSPEIIEQETSPDADKMLKKLRKKRVIEKAKILRWQSRIFTVPKKDSPDGRLILDLSFLNTFIKCPHFKMLTIREVKLLLPRGCWTISIDFKDGFWHLPVARGKRPFLGFRWKNQNWQFRAMPFGLNVAPRIFTKVVAHAVKVLAEEGIWCLPYLDDLLIVAYSQEECLMAVERSVKILKSLGWLLNLKKSRLNPAQRFEWLGVQFDLTTHTAMVPKEKLNLLQERLKEVLTAESSSIREIMQLQGMANWIGMHDPIARLMLSRTRKIIKTFKRMDIDKPVTLSKNMKLSLCKWIVGVPVPQSLGAPSPDYIIQTDASLHGWGFVINSTSFSGKFDKSMTYSINILELLTVWFSLLMISKRNVVIQILCDNSTSIAAVRRASSLVPHIATLTELIWRRAASLQWTLSIAHIQGSFNVIADQLSRGVELTTEWSLSTKDFQKILKMNPLLHVDLFATSLNNQLPTFVSPCPDMKAAAVDALSTPWEQWEHLYLFPPTNLVPKVLAKLASSQFKSAVLVTTETPTRPWYMALKLRKVPSVLLEVQLQQIVVNQLVMKPSASKLRVWQLLRLHTKGGFQTAMKPQS